MLSALTVFDTKDIRTRLNDCGIGWSGWPAFESIPSRVAVRT